MNQIIRNKKLNYNFYQNLIIKMKDKDSIINIGFQLSTPIKNCFIISTRFYKIYSFRDDIPIDYILKIFNLIFPNEISIYILKFYLRNDISFRSIEDTNKNTLRYQQKLEIIPNFLGQFSIKTFNILPHNSSYFKNQKENFDIASMIFNKFKKLLTYNEKFDTNEIFRLDDTNIDFCYQHKIFSSDIAWGFSIE